MLKRFIILLILLVFILPVMAAVGWDTSEIVYLSSMEEGNHIGEATSGLIFLSTLRYGDIDNNTQVESYDGALVLQYIVNIDPGPVAPLPWENWRLIIADVSGDEFIGAYDAGLILQYAIGMINIFPVEEEPVLLRLQKDIPTNMRAQLRIRKPAEGDK
ncbi:MAG: hypothetical protein K9N06_08305 [Candidatus Cloacimonetes bacterium]|nr:hypothetical protein [Candidatus Cloacimonadota bacterium]